MHLRQGIKPQRYARDTQKRTNDMVPEVFRFESTAAASHHKRDEDGAEKRTIEHEFKGAQILRAEFHEGAHDGKAGRSRNRP